ncbi:MAG TPA: hypothetical protein VGM25_02845 [Caulobacteraceae bacterium]|jgi:hypothetical protein
MMAASAPSRVRTGELLPARPCRRTVRVRLWLPLTPLFWLLSPLALLLAPFVWVCLPPGVRPARPYAAAIALGGLLVSVGGTVVDVHAPGARVNIRIF